MNTPKSTDRQQRLENTTTRDITRELDRSLECDPYELERLADIRAHALTALPADKRPADKRPANQKPRYKPWAFALATTAATLAVAVVMLYPDLPVPDNHPSQQPALAELEWLVDDAELEMLETELEFYQWAAEEVEDPS